MASVPISACNDPVFEELPCYISHFAIHVILRQSDLKLEWIEKQQQKENQLPTDSEEEVEENENQHEAAIDNKEEEYHQSLIDSQEEVDHKQATFDSEEEEEEEEEKHDPTAACDCQVSANYNLPCCHTMPDTISLADIPSFWHLQDFGKFILLEVFFFFFF
jgi:hypothetical protein